MVLLSLHQCFCGHAPRPCEKWQRRSAASGLHWIWPQNSCVEDTELEIDSLQGIILTSLTTGIVALVAHSWLIHEPVSRLLLNQLGERARAGVFLMAEFR